MTSPYPYKLIDIEPVVKKLSRDLRLRFFDNEIGTAFAELSLSPPTATMCDYVRKLCISEIERKMQALCAQLSNQFCTTPKPGDLDAALLSKGYTSSRPFRKALMEMLKQQNSQQWDRAASGSEKAVSKKVVSLTQGERALWDALQRTYALKSDMLVPSLLRLFAVVTVTGKVNVLNVPYLTSSVSDKELQSCAQSLNFVVNQPNKSSA